MSDLVDQISHALIEESTAASDALNNQAPGLREEISFFKVNDGNGLTSQSSHAIEPSRGATPSAPARHTGSKPHVAEPVDSEMDDWAEF